MFALGTLLYFLKTQQFPWPLAVKSCQTYSLIAKGRANLFWRSKSLDFERGFFDEDFKDLLSNLWKADFNERLTVEQALEHPWILNDQDEPFDRELFVQQMKAKLT